MFQNPSHSRIKPTWTLTRLALCCALLLGGCSQENLTTEEHVQRAKDFSRQGKTQEAQIELRNALQQDPKNPQVHLLMAEMSMAIGNPYLAEVELKKARDSGVAPEAIKVEMARALLMQGRVEEALKQAEPSERDSTGNRQRLLDMQARALLALGKLDESCARAQAAHDLQPDTVIAAQAIARCAVLSGKDYQRAEDLLRGALKKDPNDATTLSQLGDVLRLRGQLPKAVESYQAALAHDPLQLSTRTRLIDLYLDDDRLEEARKLIQDGLKVANAPKLLYLQALVDFRQGNHAKAAESLAQFLKNDPDYMPAVFLNGAIALNLNKIEQAAKELGRYLAQHPDNARARRLLASAQLRQGGARQALETLKPLLDGASADGIALTQAGEAYQVLGEHRQAIGSLQQAASLDPKGGRQRTLLGMSYLAAGDSASAVTELTRAAQLDAGSTQADRLLIGYYMGRNAFDQALAAIVNMEKKSPPNDPEPHNQRGLAYLGKKDYGAARASFEKARSLNPAYLPAASGLARLDVLQSKNYKAAQQRFEAVLTSDKGNVDAMVALARLAEMQRKDNEYADWLRKAVAVDKTPGSRLLLAEHLLDKKDVKSAMAIAREASSNFPDSTETLALLARVQAAAGDKENAMATYAKLVTKAPKAPAGYYALGLLQAEAKQWTAARQSLSKAFELTPNSAKVAEALATLEFAQKRPEQAIQVARRFQKATPKSSAGLVLEGDLLVNQGKAKEAAKVLGKAYALDKSINILIKLHRAQALAGDTAEADKRLQAWLQASPKDTTVRQYFATTLAARGAYPEAAKQYETLLANAPNNPFATNDLAWIYAKMNDPRALATAEQAVKLHPRGANALDTLGWILVEKGQLPRGLSVLEQAVASSEGARPDIRYHLAAALARSGDKARARKELEQALRTPFPQQAEAKALMQELR